MFIPDGSDIDYDAKKSLKGRYSWGWLGDSVTSDSWQNTEQKQEVVSRLKSFKASRHHMGHHDCEVCLRNQGIDNPRSAARNYQEWLERQAGPKPPKPEIASFNGSYLIQYKGMELRCPAGVEHYIEKHDYNPGSFVIAAILHGEEIHDDY